MQAISRIDSETGNGLVTDVCLKRKIRNYVQVAKGIEKNFDIFVKEKAVLDNLVNEIYETEEVKHAPKAEMKDLAKKALCDKYFDIRTFGAVIATKDKQGQVRGPIQLTFARSIDPIAAAEHSITRMAVTKAEDIDKERTMGRKATVPYGLYVCHGFISANLAKQTGFDEADLELFWEALANMFDVDRSAARGLMSAQKLIVFKHDSILGNAPANKLFQLVEIKKICDGAPREFYDYQVTIDTDHLPQGVTMEEKI